MNKMSKKTIEQMAGGLFSIATIQESHSIVSDNPFRVVLKDGYMNIGNLDALEGRGFKMLGFGIDEQGKLFIDFDVARPKVRA